ncbi:hypothetical protein ACFX14_029347 [Malus domestica]
MAEHGGELAAEEPMKLASGIRIESNYRFPSDSPRKPTPVPASPRPPSSPTDSPPTVPASPRPLSSPGSTSSTTSTPSFKKRAESDALVPAPAKAEKFAQRGSFLCVSVLSLLGDMVVGLLAAIGAPSGA